MTATNFRRPLLRLALALVAGLAPPLAAAFWPAPAPATAMEDHGRHVHDTSHTPVAVPHATDDASVPPDVGAAVWDGQLPAWHPSGRTLTVGQNHAYPNLVAALAEARDGDHITLMGGLHQGPFTVNRAIWLEGRQGAMLLGDNTDTVVRVTAPGARITNLTIRHSGQSLDREHAGIYLDRAPGAVVAGCTLEDVLFGVVAKQSDGVLVAGNRITGKGIDLALAGEGIRVWYSHNARVLANTVRHTREVIIEQSENAVVYNNAVVDGRLGLHLMRAPGADARYNYLVRNSTGIYVMYGADTTVLGNWVQDNRGPSGYGVGLKEADAAHVANNWLIRNRVGIYLDNSPLQADKPNLVAGNLVAFNDTGVLFTPSTGANTFTGNDFMGNLQQVGATGGGTGKDNRWTRNDRGNYWSDYAGYDADGDGVGDIAYAPVRTFEGWMDRRPALRWFWLSPAATAVDLAAKAFPVTAGEPWLVDNRPVLRQAERSGLPWSCCKE